MASPSVDARLAGPTITALQGLLTMREAQFNALREDSQKLIEELKAKCGDRCTDPPQTAGVAPPAGSEPPKIP